MQEFMVSNKEQMENLEGRMVKSVMPGLLCAIYSTFTLHFSSGNVCYLEHFFIGSTEIQKNLYLETFFNMF